MGAYFNGRYFARPTAASRIDTSALAAASTGGVESLLIIGECRSGEPKRTYIYASVDDAIAAHGSGVVVDCLRQAGSPGGGFGAPQRVGVIRINPATQAQLGLKDTADNIVMTVKPDWGVDGNRVKIKVEAGTAAGTKKITVSKDSLSWVGDNIAKPSFTVQYTGENATATMTVTATELAIAAGDNDSIELDFATYQTIQHIVDALNATGLYTAAVVALNATDPAIELDHVAAADVKGGVYTACSDLQAAVEWFRDKCPVIATITPGVTRAPLANVATTYCTGGSEGTPTSIDWASGLEAAQAGDWRHIFPATTDASVHAAAAAHCTLMEQRGKPRIAWVGGAAGETVAERKDRAYALNSYCTFLVCPGIKDVNAAGEIVTLSPMLAAAKVAGAAASGGPTLQLTRRYLSVLGLENEYTPAELDELTEAGCTVLERTDTGYRIVHFRSTWTADTLYHNVEGVTRRCLNQIARDVHDAVDQLAGSTSRTLVAEVISRIESTLKTKEREGLIVAGTDPSTGEAVPAFRNVQAQKVGDVVYANYEAAVLIPGNYIFVTAHLQTT